MSTDIDYWGGEFARSVPPWDERNDIMIRFLRPGDRVVDFGAGSQTIRSRIPKSCQYFPVDCAAVTPDTFVIDYNSEYRFPDIDPTIAYCSGFFEFIEDIDSLFYHMSGRYPGLFTVFSYGHTKRSTKRWAEWTQDIGEAEYEVFFAKYFADLRTVDEYRSGISRQAIMTGCLRS